MTPTILDLPECAQNHGLLLELGEKYSEWVGGTFDNVAWSWPSTKRLHEVVSLPFYLQFMPVLVFF